MAIAVKTPGATGTAQTGPETPDILLKTTTLSPIPTSPTDDGPSSGSEQYRETTTTRTDKAEARKRLSTVATIGGYLIEPKFPGFLGVFDTVHPLLLEFTSMTSKAAYRSFKLFAQLQRVTRNPYLYEGAENFKYLSSWRKEDRFLEANLSKYVRLATAIYGAEQVIPYGIQYGKFKVRSSDTIENLVFRILPGATLISSRMTVDVCKPIWMMLKDDKLGEIYIIIQGSTEIDDWKTNLLCDRSNETGTHRGMQLAADNLDAEMRTDFLNTFGPKKRKYKVFLTGHSLGAGCAALLAIKWLDQLPRYATKDLKVFAFACPCIVPKRTAKRYEDRIYSITFGKDLVPKLSFESFRDLTIILQALARYMKTCETRKPPTESEVLDSMRQDEAESEIETKKLPLRRDESPSSASTTADGLSDKERFGNVKPLKLNLQHLSEQRNREEAENLALKMATVDIDLPLSFNQITTILKKRIKKLDELQEAVSMAGLAEKKVSWFTRFMWKLCKLCKGGCGSTNEPLELTEAAEDKLLKQCITILMGLVEPMAHDDLMPPGRGLLVVPKLHFVEARRKPPCPYNRGQCIVFKLSFEQLTSIVERPVWSVSAIKEHTAPYYLQGLASDCLARIPLRTMPTQQLKKSLKKLGWKEI